MHYIESEVTKTSYIYRLSGSMRIQVMPMESGLCLSPTMAALVVSLVASVLYCTAIKWKLFFHCYDTILVYISENI